MVSVAMIIEHDFFTLVVTKVPSLKFPAYPILQILPASLLA